jgi:hypothetical protein
MYIRCFYEYCFCEYFLSGYLRGEIFGRRKKWEARRKSLWSHQLQIDFHTNLVPRAMPVRGLGRHWLWGNWQPEPLNLGVPVLCRHARLTNVKPITAQEKFNFLKANAFLARAQALLWVRDCFHTWLGSVFSHVIGHL